jgi:hypothetical protein
MDWTPLPDALQPSTAFVNAARNLGENACGVGVVHFITLIDCSTRKLAGHAVPLSLRIFVKDFLSKTPHLFYGTFQGCETCGIQFLVAHEQTPFWRALNFGHKTDSYFPVTHSN